MAKVLRSIMGRKEKPSPAAVAAPAELSADEADDRLQGERSVSRRVSVSRSGRYKQRNKRRSGLWDNPQLVDEPAEPAAAAPAGHDKENDDAGSVRSKDSLRSRGSSVLQDTSQVAQELLDLAEQQLNDATGHSPIVTNL